MTRTCEIPIYPTLPAVGQPKFGPLTDDLVCRLGGVSTSMSVLSLG